MQNGEPNISSVLDWYDTVVERIWGVTYSSDIFTETIWWLAKDVNLQIACNNSCGTDYIRLFHAYHGSKIARAFGLDIFYLDDEPITVRNLNPVTWEKLHRRATYLYPEVPVYNVDLLWLELDTYNIYLERNSDTRSAVSDQGAESTIWWPGIARDSVAHRRAASFH